MPPDMSNVALLRKIRIVLGIFMNKTMLLIIVFRARLRQSGALLADSVQGSPRLFCGRVPPDALSAPQERDGAPHGGTSNTRPGSTSVRVECAPARESCTRDARSKRQKIPSGTLRSTLSPYATVEPTALREKRQRPQLRRLRTIPVLSTAVSMRLPTARPKRAIL